MIKCISRKKVYATLGQAEDALLAAWTNFAHRPDNGPIAVYQCDDCGQFHLTSKGAMNKKLTEFINSGKLKQQAEADHWLAKLKGK